MAKVQLMEIAIARSGDKGDGSNVGIMGKTPAIYEFLKENLTEEVVKDFFKEICFGKVKRFEIPNLQVLNFLLDDSLGGGGTETLILDAQGKVHGPGLLHMEMDVPDELLQSVRN
ncbi:MAG: hypothetical protein R3E73_10740 [Porticoccaceae bacterium]|nr:hypothetical protein [Pseudomonadales bacterium]MCP5171119.1 hypothetical protein [Pseudomonadales bacterium]MCP5301644.1 hypothetical protein [Pseudomonadales bacterium]